MNLSTRFNLRCTCAYFAAQDVDWDPHPAANDTWNSASCISFSGHPLLWETQIPDVPQTEWASVLACRASLRCVQASITFGCHESVEEGACRKRQILFFLSFNFKDQIADTMEKHIQCRITSTIPVAYLLVSHCSSANSLMSLFCCS